MRDRDELDRLVDAALVTYADSEHGSGLEQRILARIDAARATNQLRWRWLWAAGIPALAACLLLSVFAPWQHPAPLPPQIEPPRHSIVAETSRPEIPRHIDRPAPHAETAALHSRPRPAAAPKLDVFPTPVPLSAQERALVRYVTEASEVQRKDLMEAQEQTVAPLDIAAISIPPIEPPAKGNE